MNTLPMIRSCLGMLDDVVLRPAVSLSLSTYNRRTGACSSEKSMSASTSVTALRAMLAIAAALVAMYGFLCFFRFKERQKLRRAMKKRRRRG